MSKQIDIWGNEHDLDEEPNLRQLFGEPVELVVEYDARIATCDPYGVSGDERSMCWVGVDACTGRPTDGAQVRILRIALHEALQRDRWCQFASQEVLHRLWSNGGEADEDTQRIARSVTAELGYLQSVGYEPRKPPRDVLRAAEFWRFGQPTTGRNRRGIGGAA